MTTLEIETLANHDSLASGSLDTNLKLIHRQIVIPEFLKDIDRVIGRVHWRRKTTTFSVVAGTRNYDCPTDFGKFSAINLVLASGVLGSALTYIGEDDASVIAAENATLAVAPSAYYLVQGSTNVLKAIRIGAPSDAAYTLRAVYYRRIPFADNTTTVDLDAYIEPQHQSGLVKRLRMELLRDRIGIRDSRYEVASGEYEAYLEGLEYHKEAAPRGTASFVR